jgi:phage terminase large subunit GpA-like protein
MDCLSVTSDVQEVIFMKGAQVAGTEVGNNWISYVIDYDPGPMMMVLPSTDIAKRTSKTRIAPLIRDNDRIRLKISDQRGKDGRNTILSKEFPGGYLMLVGANNAAGLRSQPAGKLFLDEVDAYPLDVEGEGDPVGLVKARSRTFSRRKMFAVSTPTFKSSSRIYKLWLETDQRKRFLPCPHGCGHWDWLQFKNFIIPKDANGKYLPEQAHFVCLGCGGVIENYHKSAMLPQGEWRVTAPENESPRRRGYHLSSFYSPIGWFSWAEIAQKWVEIKGDVTKLKEFINTVLGECWEDQGESVDHTGLAKRAEDYPADPLPQGVVLLTAGVDVQHNRLEAEIVGWGRGQESWGIEYVVIHGDPTSDSVWMQLDLLLQRPRTMANGVQIRPARTVVDSGDGHHTQRIYSYTGPRASLGIFAGKGLGGDDKPVCGAPSKQKMGDGSGYIQLLPVGTFAAKDMLFYNLRLGDPGRGYCHFPKRYSSEWYEQLTVEEVRTKYLKGNTVREWRKKTDGARNEALDCRVYAMAGLYSLSVDLDQLADIMENAKQMEPPRARSIRGQD